MQYDWEVWHTTFDFFQNIKTQHWFLTRFEFKRAMAGTNRNCQGVYTCTAYEFFYLFRLSVFCIFCTYVYIVFDACQLPQFTFYYYAMSMGIFYYFFGQCNIIFERMMRTINHNRGKTTIDTSFANFKICTVV